MSVPSDSSSLQVKNALTHYRVAVHVSCDNSMTVSSRAIIIAVTTDNRKGGWYEQRALLI